MTLPQRKPTRLKDYDYNSLGAYFVTICTHQRKCILSTVGANHDSPEIQLTEYGLIVDRVIKQLPNRFGVQLDAYVIMPNHIHILFRINDVDYLRAIHESPLQTNRNLVSKIVGYLKMNASKEIHLNVSNEQIWQRSFHDHIVRNEKDYLEIWDYIENNPCKWEEDKLYIQ